MITFQFPGKVVLVTGSSRGIGAAVLAGFAKAGATCVLHYWDDPDGANRKDAEALAAHLQALPGAGALHVLSADVRDAAQVESLMKQVKEKCGGLDILVNNAGISDPGWLLEKSRANPALFPGFARELFDAMAKGGHFGLEEIVRFNGNLFEAGPVLELTAEEIHALYEAARLDWSAVDPSIFGTLFERGMDPDKRSQLGAHYTSREDIETLVEPVVMRPLRREWREVCEMVESLLATGRKKPDGKETAPPAGGRLKKARTEADLLLRRFHERLVHLKVLDPACGSGNFLYVTLQKLKDLEKEVILYSMERGFPGLLR